ncbi:hypothetical protein [Chitinophaga sp.]|uniref:hypothetical protein n=1 Tax=Chitinophaga sp. TaxID=1869181 RepID=UPI002F9325C7
MKRIVLLFALLCLLSSAKAQLFCDTVLTFARSAPPTNGVKIKTNLPFVAGGEMPTIIIEGYNQGTMDPIGLIINFYIDNGGFANTRVSSYGSYTPPVSLGNENGKVVIFLDSRDANQRFAIRAFARGLPQDIPINYQGWSVVDEAFTAATLNKVDVTYLNKFPGTVIFPSNGVWNLLGRIGLHTTSPKAPLHVVAAANDTMPGSPGFKLAAVLGNAYNEWTAFGAPNGGRIRGSNEGYLVLETNTSGTNNRMYLNAASSSNIIMATGGGSVGIGTVDPGTSRLAVEGTIAARKVKVTSNNPWPDYVFGKDYSIMSLGETEKYIQTHRHLPDMPSAKEVAENGLDLGEMNRKLLEKVEEMTLHMIRMQKKIDELESKMQAKP